LAARSKAAGLAILLTWGALSSAAHAGSLEEAQRRRDADVAAGHSLVAHVVVALCDNDSQGIVPVPAKLGDGNDPSHNLYWGAMYGVRAWFKRSPEWRSLPISRSEDARVLDRVLFRRELLNGGRRVEALLLAEAWRGRHIADALQHFLEIDRGEHVQTVRIGDRDVAFGGAAHVNAFIGHNGLMDFDAPVLPRSGPKPRAHASVVLACMSQQYFSPVLNAHSVPLLLTTGLMAPEAYTLDAVLTSWFSGESSAEVRLAAARAYARHQRTSERAALRLFTTPH
jgi:hypothetical protein